MASDNLSQVGKYIRGAGRKADQAIKRVKPIIRKSERTRDAVSSVFPFKMTVTSDGEKQTRLHIHFNKPPPDGCGAECIATVCESFPLFNGGRSITVTNPYEPDSVNVYTDGVPLDRSRWNEENPSGGQVYVQVQSDVELIIICYTYVTC